MKLVEEIVRKIILLSTCFLVLAFISYFAIKFYFDGSSDTAIKAIEEVKGGGRVDYIVHEINYLEGTLIFYLHYFDDKSLELSADYVKKTWKGWKWVYGGGLSASNIHLHLSDAQAKSGSFSYMYFRNTRGIELGYTPFPIISGIIVNPEISRIVVKDYHTGLEKQVSIVEVTEKFKLYYVFLDEAQGLEFDMLAYDRYSNVIKQKTINGGKLSNSSIGEKVAEE